MRKLAIVFVALIGLLLVVDRVGVAVAEHVVSHSLQDSQHLASAPDVDISGFPFLTQLLAEEFDKVSVTAKNVPLGTDRAELNVSRVSVVMRDVKVNLSLHRIVVGSGEGGALVTYVDLSKTLGARVTYEGDGKIAATKYGLRIVTTPTLVQGALGFGATTVNNSQGAIEKVIAAAKALFGLDIPLDQIPFGLGLKSLTANPAGIAVVLTGRDVTLTARR